MYADPNQMNCFHISIVNHLTYLQRADCRQAHAQLHTHTHMHMPIYMHIQSQLYRLQTTNNQNNIYGYCYFEYV